MKKLIKDDYLLFNHTAKKLYEAVSDLPIFDYHCHISVKQVYDNNKFADIAELWLKEDHYKWRAMRGCAISEEYITGDQASGFEKFSIWMNVLPKCIGNVLYNWSMLELVRAFGIQDIIDEKNVMEMWHKINKMLADDAYTPRNMLKTANVTYMNTTDDPIDTMDYHKALRDDTKFQTKIMPTWRPDNVVDIEKDGFPGYLKKLREITSVTIDSFEALKRALILRMDDFGANGCVAADHSFGYVPFNPLSDQGVEEVIGKRLSGALLSVEERDGYKTELMTFLAREYAKRGWAMALHIGAMRDNNTRMFEKIGQNGGFDSINDSNIAVSLSRFLNRLDYSGELPKTILFALNPKDYYVVASMTGNFQNDNISGKIQFGTAWWFNDHIDGIRRQIKDVANLSVLANCIGMVTDSRCLLSMFSRHELYRRILCNMIGDWMEKGLYIGKINNVIDIVRDISFYNAKRYFNQ